MVSVLRLIQRVSEDILGSSISSSAVAIVARVVESLIICVPRRLPISHLPIEELDSLCSMLPSASSTPDVGVGSP